MYRTSIRERADDDKSQGTRGKGYPVLLIHISVRDLVINSRIYDRCRIFRNSDNVQQFFKPD
ncbi:predicted protein [Sclerotinia sclerotiorum 1980 UF-70]|uniref:Uncharacterized protein n=1 Tax=Sclerotinia sclerotiorum (strain ATCC 18683 / 1980 / Ss-1) TaxID=665079 RepID=A7EJX2_SCLS1|nr:predicted protein [Sclerotinia sclerotiorum 1980 UF-70]XP_001592697.1 predicted protein [Sclerotinia sclerotiorum 1980 UF-70]EDN93272.1 predicted protein [Sclerotinia sclerotiorum 1980 UF-70]EDO03138.1 predicted protein [Sclerotinia sclerotiorum 1980 UF-70]